MPAPARTLRLGLFQASGDMKVNLDPLIRFFKHLPKSGDVELAVLKCHLLCEEVLTKLIERHLRYPEHLLNAKLSFAQKISLAKCCSGNNVEWLWPALHKLNKARNQLAHGLSSEILDAKLQEFIAHVEASEGTTPPEMTQPPFGKFQWAAFRVFASLAVIAHFDPTELKIPSLLGTTDS